MVTALKVYRSKAYQHHASVAGGTSDQHEDRSIAKAFNAAKLSVVVQPLTRVRANTGHLRHDGTFVR